MSYRTIWIALVGQNECFWTQIEREEAGYLQLTTQGMTHKMTEKGKKRTKLVVPDFNRKKSNFSTVASNAFIVCLWLNTSVMDIPKQITPKSCAKYELLTYHFIF